MVNPGTLASVSNAARRANHAHKFRKEGEATDFDLVPDIGGPWDGEQHSGTMEALEHGWGGWSDTDTPPWEPRHDLTLIGNGGVYTRDRHRETIAGIVYQSHVAGDRDVEVGGDCALIVHSNLTTQTSGSVKMRVHGDAYWKTHDKVTMAAGHLNRRWEGAIMRKIGMEGIIAGGFFSKTFTGCSMTMAPLASGDVYGGCIQVSASRSRISNMGYRSSEMCAWQCGLYNRAAGSVIEPIAGTPSADGPRKLWQKAGRIGMGLCPLADIIIGLAMMPVGIGMAIKNKIKKPKKPPTPGVPRLHTRNSGVVTQSRASDKII